MSALYLAILAAACFGGAVWAFCAKRDHFLALFGSGTTLAAAFSMWLLLGMLEESGKAIPGWFLNQPVILVAYGAAYVLGMTAIAVGCFRLLRNR